LFVCLFVCLLGSWVLCTLAKYTTFGLIGSWVLGFLAHRESGSWALGLMSYLYGVHLYDTVSIFK
jgi:hypothetical protein